MNKNTEEKESKGELETVNKATGGGLVNPANHLSDYIMKIADIYHPVVIARAGRKVSVMFSKGFWIDNAHQTYESGKALDNEEAQNDSGITTHISRLNSAEAVQVASSSQEAARTENTSSDGAEAQFLKEHAQSNDPLFSVNTLQGEPNHG
jgi:conjugal transfer pilus assembly protein TraB